MQTEFFPVLTTTSTVFDKWRKIGTGELALTEWDMRLLAVVDEAITSGVFYVVDMRAYVSARIPVNPADLVFGHHGNGGNTEGGSWGYEVYEARVYLEQKKKAQRRQAAAAKLTAGQVFRNIRIQSHKISTLTIKAILPGGFVSFDGKKRGSPRAWEGKCSATYFEGVTA